MSTSGTNLVFIKLKSDIKKSRKLKNLSKSLKMKVNTLRVLEYNQNTKGIVKNNLFLWTLTDSKLESKRLCPPRKGHVLKRKHGYLPFDEFKSKILDRMLR